MSPVFLTLDEVLQIHQDQIRRYGGANGIRDLGLLQSALSQPPATFGGHFLHADLFAMSSAYMFHIVRNHPFVDGNKRVGVVAAIVFLLLNDQDIDATEPELETLVLDVAKGVADKNTVTEFFRQHAV